MRVYRLTILGAFTLLSAYGASYGPLSTKTNNSTFAQGDTGDSYNIFVNNNGNYDTDGSTITISDTLPTGESNPMWVSYPSGWTCTTSGNTATCTSNPGTVIGGQMSNPPNGQTVGPFVLSVNVSNTAPATVTNCAMISGGGAAASANICDTDQPITPEPYLTITKTQTNPVYNGTPLPITTDQSITYKLDVDNIGGAPTSGTVKVVDTLASDMIVTNVTNGSGFWDCHYKLNVVYCSTTNAIPGATMRPGESPNIYVTATLLGTDASDTTTVTYTGVSGKTKTSTTVSSTVFGTTSVTFISNQPYVEVDGEIYASGITLQEDETINHSVYGYPKCSITAISGLTVVESRPGVNPPWSEVTGQISAPTVSVMCN